jgi:hypothetical protein
MRLPEIRQRPYCDTPRALVHQFTPCLFTIVVKKKKSSAAYLLLKRIHKRKRHIWWVQPINQRREKYGEFHKVCEELKRFPQRYFQNFRVINTIKQGFSTGVPRNPRVQRDVTRGSARDRD